MTALALAVDFGTSNTSAVLRRPDGRTEVVLFDGSPILPSAVFAQPDGRLLTGRDAIFSARTAPERFEPHPKLRVDEGTVLLGTEVPVVDLFAAVLGRVAAQAGGPFGRVVLTHPASWGPRRVGVLADAAGRASLAPLCTLAEPVAAARHLAAGQPDPGTAVVVYDLGAGTFDVSVVSGGRVLATGGLADAGGLDLDAAVIDHLGRVHRERDPAAWHRLREPVTPADRRAWWQFTDDVRTAKELLSRTARTVVHVPGFAGDAPVGREQLEQIARPLLDRTIATTRDTLTAARVAGPVRVLLVGGASRMPLVATMVHQALGTPPTVSAQPELVVAHGALAAPDPPPAEPPPAEPPPVIGPSTRRRAVIAALVGLAVLATVAVWALWPFGNRPGGGPGGGSGTLTGHSDLVFGVAFSPDGRTVATGSRDTTVRLWDVATRRQIGEPLTGHGHQVNSVAFTPDGRLLASGSSDDEVRIWDVASHQLVGPSIRHYGDAHRIEAVAFSPDGTRLATGGGPEGGILVWDVVTRRPAGGLFGHTGYISSLVYSPDGRLVAAGSSTPDHSARVWDNDTGRLVDTPDLGPSRLAFSPDGRILAASRGNSTQLWDVATWRPLGTPMVRTTREPTKGDYLAFSPDGRLLATAGTVDDAVWLWDPGTRQPVGKPLTTDCAGPLAFGPDSRTLAVTCGNDVRLVDVTKHPRG